jgi:GTP pyrophosphokinase
MTLSPRFEQALLYASAIHAGQVRKATGTPYLAHLLGVASIALEHGATEDEAIGALLHDACEDAGGRTRLEDIRVRFGRRVTGIVAGCTDAYDTPKPPWLGRKKAYLAHLPEASKSTRLVSAADKLYNARAILRDLRCHGNAVWNRFNGGKEGRLWYYRSLAEAFLKHGPRELGKELDRVVSEIEALAARAGRSARPKPPRR